jgi:hypothetical protein
MRTTRGKPTLEVRTAGDAAIASALAASLRHEEQVERATHGFHTWPAGLHPDTARDLLPLLPAGRLLDPFMGGGTVLVEALIAGREVYGNDLSEVAHLVASARTARVDDEALTAFRSAGRRIAEQARGWRGALPPGLRDAIEPWYDPATLQELLGLREGVAAMPPGWPRRLAWACFSSILVKVSRRVSDTVLRVDPSAGPRPQGTTSVLFHKKVRELGRRLEALRALCPAELPPASLRVGDARRLATSSVRFDAVLTSPPYPAVYDYLRYQELRERWLGFDSAADDELGARRSWRPSGRPGDDPVRRWRDGTVAWMAAVSEAVSPGGAMIVVIGDGLVEGSTVDALGPTVEIGSATGWRRVASASALRPDHARDAGRWEHAVLLSRHATPAW